MLASLVPMPRCVATLKHRRTERSYLYNFVDTLNQNDDSTYVFIVLAYAPKPPRGCPRCDASCDLVLPASGLSPPDPFTDFFSVRTPSSSPARFPNDGPLAEAGCGPVAQAISNVSSANDLSQGLGFKCLPSNATIPVSLQPAPYPNAVTVGMLFPAGYVSTTSAACSVTYTLDIYSPYFYSLPWFLGLTGGSASGNAAAIPTGISTLVGGLQPQDAAAAADACFSACTTRIDSYPGIYQPLSVNATDVLGPYDYLFEFSPSLGSTVPKGCNCSLTQNCSYISPVIDEPYGDYESWLPRLLTTIKPVRLGAWAWTLCAADMRRPAGVENGLSAASAGFDPPPHPPAPQALSSPSGVPFLCGNSGLRFNASQAVIGGRLALLLSWPGRQGSTIPQPVTGVYATISGQQFNVTALNSISPTALLPSPPLSLPPGPPPSPPAPPYPSVLVHSLSSRTRAGITAGAVIGSVLVLGACSALVYMYRREREGTPVFTPLAEDITRAEALRMEARIPQTHVELGGAAAYSSDAGSAAGGTKVGASGATESAAAVGGGAWRLLPAALPPHAEAATGGGSGTRGGTSSGAG